MKGKQLIIGYSPFNTPNFNPIHPFDEIYDKHLNLMNAHPDDIAKIDALLLWGGSDISPKLYDEYPFPPSGPIDPSHRDLFEWELIKEASTRGIPIIGVCRGSQILCAAAGGKLIQNVQGHGQSHWIETNDGKKFFVSSSHHQMMFPYDVPDHELLAWSTEHRASVYQPYGTPHSERMTKKEEKEAEVVFFNELNALAIQCHPEWHDNGAKDPFNKWMFEIILELFFD